MVILYRNNNKKKATSQAKGQRLVGNALASVLFLVFLVVCLFSYWWSSTHWTSLDEASSSSSSSLVAQVLDEFRTPTVPWIVFYHIYIPSHKGKAGRKKAVNIVEEQLAQLGDRIQASAAQRTDPLRWWKLYYYTTGVSGALTKSQMNQLCARHHLLCQDMGHVDDGYEDETLNRLYQYCQTHGNATVVYLHAKGTFHSAGGRNDVWRRHLTDAAIHPDCITSIQSGVCDVCGLQFYPVWTTFFPGNMFAAHCSHVRKLLPLPNFSQAMHNAVAAASLLPTKQQKDKAPRSDRSPSSSSLWQTQLYNGENPGNMGLDRYSAEHWIASHPHVRPCDLSPTVRLSEWSDVVTATNHTHHEQWTWSLAPRHSIRAPWYRLNHTVLDQVLENHNHSAAREYFLLPGFLYRWHRIYGMYPRDDSWVWKWFPNGPEWKHAVQAMLDSASSSMTTREPSRDSSFYPWWMAD